MELPAHEDSFSFGERNVLWSFISTLATQKWQRVVPGTSIAPASSGSLLEIQILRPHPGKPEPAFSQDPWLILCSVQSEKLCPGESCLTCSDPITGYLLQPPTYLLAGLCCGNTQTCGVASILLICVLISAAEIC